MTTPAGVTPTPIDWANLIQAGRDLLNPQQAGHTAVARTRPPSGEQRVLRHVPFPGPQQRHSPGRLSHKPNHRRSVVPDLPRPRPHHRKAGTAKQPPGTSPYQPRTSLTRSPTYNSAVTRPTTTPTPSSQSTTAPYTSTGPNRRSWTSPRSHRTSGRTSPR